VVAVTHDAEHCARRLRFDRLRSRGPAALPGRLHGTFDDQRQAPASGRLSAIGIDRQN
jgi:hypothetical protein